jgi:hypothetical protein
MFVSPPFGINVVMRIGTWNMNNSSMKAEHRDVLHGQAKLLALICNLDRNLHD